MTTLKNKIKIIETYPPEQKHKKSLSSIIFTFLIIIILISITYIAYIKLIPYINAININNIVGKKIYNTNCNTKDYIIINKDKSYTMSLTNDICKNEYYEGNITIKNNEIIFNKNLKGTIDSNYNIIINNNLFESDKNE